MGHQDPRQFTGQQWEGCARALRSGCRPSASRTPSLRALAFDLQVDSLSFVGTPSAGPQMLEVPEEWVVALLFRYFRLDVGFDPDAPFQIKGVD